MLNEHDEYEEYKEWLPDEAEISPLLIGCVICVLTTIIVALVTGF